MEVQPIQEEQNIHNPQEIKDHENCSNGLMVQVD